MSETGATCGKSEMSETRVKRRMRRTLEIPLLLVAHVSLVPLFARGEAPRA